MFTCMECLSYTRFSCEIKQYQLCSAFSVKDGYSLQVNNPQKQEEGETMNRLMKLGKIIACMLVFTMAGALTVYAASKEEKAAKKLSEERAEAGFKEVQKLAESGEAEAQYILGYAFYTGKSVEQSDVEALAWWNKAAKQGHREADAYVGLGYKEGFGGSLINQDEARRRFKRAAGKGSPLAQLLLGIEYYQTDLPDKKAEAAELFRLSAEKGNEIARSFLRLIMRKGFAAKQEFGKSIKWKKEAQKVDLVTLETQAGINYFKGNGAALDYGQAVKWWQIAADQEDTQAQALLGTAYYTGRGIGQDYTKAVEYLKLAAVKKDPLAQFTLGKAYYEGNGVRKNNEIAAELFRAAGNSGIDEAVKMANTLEGRK